MIQRGGAGAMPKEADKKQLVKYKEPAPCAAFEYIENGQDVIIKRDVIDKTIAEICSRQGIEDLRKEKQRAFKAVMSDVGASLFPGRKMLKDNKLIYIYTANNNNLFMGNNNKYNFIILNRLLDVYINICQLYCKVLDVDGFASFANMDPDVIYTWGSRGEESSPQGYSIYKKIYKQGETSLQDGLIDTGQAVGMIAVGNNRFKWSEQEQAGITRAKIQSLDSLPTLEIVKTVDIT